MIKRQLVGIALLIALASFPAATPKAAEAWFEFEKTFEVDGPISLHLTLTAGNVYITSGKGKALVVEGIKRVWGREFEDAKRVADLIQIDVKQGGNQFAVATNYLPLDDRDRSLLGDKFEGGASHYGNVDYRITAPAFTSVTVDGKAAVIELSSIDGDVIVVNGSGSVSGESLFGTVKIAQTLGDIELANVEGSIDIDNGSGITRGEFLVGPITLRQGGGEVDLQWIEGDIRIKSASSTVKVGQLRGAIDLANGEGDVFVRTELDSPRDFFVQTGSGKIVFSVPRSSAGTLKIETESGVIATELPVAVRSMTANHLEGVFGNGGVRIKLSSSSGDVTLAGY